MTSRRNLLSQKACLAGLTMSAWTARRIDRKVTDKVNRDHNASRDAGRYNKMLIAPTALEALQKVRSAARSTHLAMTQPWLDEAGRILPTALYADYAEKMRKFRIDYEAEADDFARQYPQHVAEARQRLNGMFRADDYPAPHAIRAMFSFDVKLLPCPDASDFRVDLADEHADDIRADIEERMRKALDEAMREPVRRIIDTVGHMAERLRAYKPSGGRGDRTEGQFRDTLVQNVRDLVDLLPAFNLTGDQLLSEITERMARELCVTDADELRDNRKARKTVAAAAESILAQAKDFIA